MDILFGLIALAWHRSNYLYINILKPKYAMTISDGIVGIFTNEPIGEFRKD